MGVHTAPNQHDEKKFEYYWGYKNHVLVDCITGLPIFEMTTGANVDDSTVALDILSRTNEFLPIQECSFLADKGYDVKSIYNTECERYNSRFKATGQERLWVRNAKSAENLNTVAHISLLAVAIAAVSLKTSSSFRCSKLLQRSF